MKYLLAIILNVFYAILYEVSIPLIVVPPITIVLLLAIYKYALKTNSKIGAMLELLCFTLPFAWRNIWGTSFAEFGVSWFYLIGLAIVVLTLQPQKIIDTYLNITNLLALQFLILLIGLGLIPLLNSNDIYNGITEYIMYAFFYAIMFVSILNTNKIDEIDKHTVLKSFTYMSAYSAGAIMVQYILSTVGIELFKNEMFGSENVRYSYSYMFEDMSSASIFLVVGAMVALVYEKRIFSRPYMIMFFILTGTALSSTRTGIVAFAIVSILYILFDKKVKKKILKLSLMTISGIIIVQIYNLIRPMNSLSQVITYDNGRFDLIIASFKLFLKYPFIGTGFDSSIFLELTNSPVVGHTYLLTVLTMTGLFYTLIFVSFMSLGLYIAIKKGNTEEVWIIGVAFVGSFFIPNLMGARFLVILYALLFLSSPHNSILLNKSKNKDL